jgi:serine/threonine-protein kinase PknK
LSLAMTSTMRVDARMPEPDPTATQQAVGPDIRAELSAEGLEQAEEIGRGGFGAVYRCEQPELDRTVAVKVLTADLDPDNLERFLREQRAMGRLSGHPHIVHVLHVGTTLSGKPYIVMQYHPRGSLHERIRTHGPLDWAATLRLGVKIAGALEAAHRVGTLHRDVKPANILLTDYGEPQLTDFGIARIPGGFETEVGAVAGSPGFTAPEMLRGAQPTPASDVYGLGATLFCALTGHAVFERRSGEGVMAQFLRLSAQPVPDLRGEGVPDDVCGAIEAAMAADPATRPASAVEFGNELREVQRRHAVAVDDMALPAGTVMAQPAGIVAEPIEPATATRRQPANAPTPTPTPPTPATKYRPPTSTKALVSRERLLDALRAGRRRRLTLIHGPSGFGKTTLAAQWRDELVDEGVAVAWLTIDDDDNNVVWFLAHLVESIRRVRPALARQLSHVLDEHGDEAARYVLTSLIDEIDAADDHVVLVVDDWHRVTDAATTAALTFALDNTGERLRIIVTSRSRSGLPVGRLRVRDELVEIDSGALRFDPTEARTLLVDVDGLALRGTDVDALTATTDGWVAALQLSALSLRGGEDPARLIDHLSGRDDVGEFLAENVVDALEPDILEFLLATSITERISGSLASALAGVNRGQALLEEIEERGLFLRRVDGERHWYRYHHLFVDYLRRRLERDHGAEKVEELHRTASDWFADHHLLNEAVDHALAAGDASRAVDLVEADEANLPEWSSMSTLLGIVAKLPPRMVVARPRIQLVVAWANVLLQRPVPTGVALTRFHTALDKSGLSESERADLRAEADVLKSVLEIFADRDDTVDELIADALARPDTLPPRVAGAAANVATIAATYRFDYAAVRRWQEWAAPYHELMGPFAGIYGRCMLGIADREQLDIPAAMDTFREAYQSATASIGPHSHAARLAGTLLGDLLCDTGDIAEAAGLLDESYALGSDGGGVDFVIARYVAGARVKAAQGDLDAAARRLAEGLRAAETLAVPRLAASIVNERVRLGLEIPPADAERLRAARAVPRDAGIATVTAEIDEDSAVRLLLASPAVADREQAYQRAHQLLDGIDGARRPLAELRATLLLVKCLAALDRIDEAKRLLAPAAATCTRLGLAGLLRRERLSGRLLP